MSGGNLRPTGGLGPSPKLQPTLDLSAKGGQILTRGYDGHTRLAIEGKAFRIKASELLRIPSQRPFHTIRQAPLPKLVGRRFQKNRWPRPQQFPVPFLNESSSAERDHGVAFQRLAQQIPWRAGFADPNPGPPSPRKNLGNGFPPPPLNAGIQIHKIP